MHLNTTLLRRIQKIALETEHKANDENRYNPKHPQIIQKSSVYK